MKIYRLRCATMRGYLVDDFFQSHEECESYARFTSSDHVSIRSAEVAIGTFGTFFKNSIEEQLALWEKAYADELAREEQMNPQGCSNPRKETRSPALIEAQKAHNTAEREVQSLELLLESAKDRLAKATIHLVEVFSNENN